MTKVVENYMLKHVLGSGSYGNVSDFYLCLLMFKKVHYAQHLKNKNVVAIKVVNKKMFKEQPMLHKLTKNEI